MYEILKKDTRGSFRNRSQQEIDLATTMFQMPHSMGGYDMTPNVITHISVKVVMGSHFLGFIGSLLSSEQQLWFPNQNVQDPDESGKCFNSPPFVRDKVVRKYSVFPM